MRVFAVVALAAALGIAAPQRPALAQEKSGAKWEYAELWVRGYPARPAGKDNDGNEVPAVEGTLNLRWTAGADEFTFKEWGELAEKLKLTLKKESSPTSQKMQILNGLGAAGWELVDRQVTTPNMTARTTVSASATNMLFKRRVP